MSSATAWRWWISKRRRQELRFETRILLDHTPQDEVGLEIDAKALSHPFAYPPEEAADLAPTIRPHYPDPEVERWARRFLHPGGRTETGHLLMTLCYGIHESFAYARRSEPGTQPPRLTLALRRGTCRDFALLMIEAVRSLGFAARFVTGYVYVADRDGSDDPWRRRNPRLVPGLPPGRRLGGIRPDERHRRQPRPDPGGGGAGSEPGGAARWQLPRLRKEISSECRCR